MVKQILLLKSAFSIIDQMFHKEIQNAEIMKYSYPWSYEKLENPLLLNPFIASLMDPFKNIDIIVHNDLYS